mmetsp:Transcript_36935/g.81057  ORF Transcript_36935/g.81057 Transcript_36935/m.81057 type:complete len:361 (-) Transcript_36935:100-1182(-)
MPGDPRPFSMLGLNDPFVTPAATMPFAKAAPKQYLYGTPGAGRFDEEARPGAPQGAGSGYGKATNDARNATARGPLKAALLLLLPILVFTNFVLVFGLCHKDYRPIFWILFCLTVLASAGLATLPQFSPSAQPKLHFRLVGSLTLLAAILGTLLGFLCYSNFIDLYYNTSVGRWYGNVRPSSDPEIIGDASILTFSPGTQIDISKSAGFNHGDLYCVAPIIDTAAAAPSTGYWAVGLNCCAARGRFTCGTRMDGENHTGIVLSSTASVGHFADAVKQAGAIYDIRIPEGALLVRWVSDAAMEIDGLWHDGVLFCVLAILIAFGVELVLFCLAAGLFLAWNRSEAAASGQGYLDKYLQGPK